MERRSSSGRVTGGTRHSALIEFADHTVVIEGPLDEA
jgi:hypothetical protein